MPGGHFLTPSRIIQKYELLILSSNKCIFATWWIQERVIYFCKWIEEKISFHSLLEQQVECYDFSLDPTSAVCAWPLQKHMLNFIVMQDFFCHFDLELLVTPFSTVHQAE